MGKLNFPLDYAIISHTADSGQCTTTDACCSTVKTVQKMGFNRGKLIRAHCFKFFEVMLSYIITLLHYHHALVPGYSDIANNFLIGSDGVVYEGRGFKQGAGALHWNAKALTLSYLGLFTYRPPSETSMLSGKNFLQYLVDHSS